MSRIFWDSHLFIYLLEDLGELSERVAQIRKRMLERGDELCTSALTIAEVIAKPLELGDDALARSFHEAVSATTVVLPFDTAAAITFARLRVERAIKPPDAIQLACAAEARTDLFITSDDRLTGTRVPGVQFISSLANAPI